MLSSITSSLNKFLINNTKTVLASPLSRSYYESKKVNVNENKKDDKKNKDKIDEKEFTTEKSFGTKNLEELGMIRKNMVWPQFNRIIYPPMPDGKLIKNPFVNHMRNFIRYPAEKLWYPAFLVWILD
jgi:hypothetical protein